MKLINECNDKTNPDINLDSTNRLMQAIFEAKRITPDKPLGEILDSCLYEDGPYGGGVPPIYLVSDERLIDALEWYVKVKRGDKDVKVYHY